MAANSLVQALLWIFLLGGYSEVEFLGRGVDTGLTVWGNCQVSDKCCGDPTAPESQRLLALVLVMLSPNVSI